MTKTENTRCPGSLAAPGTKIPEGYSRHQCAVCASVRVPRRDGTFPNHKPVKS